VPQRTLSEQEFNAIRDKVLASLPQGLDESGFNRLIGSAMEQAIGEAENMPAVAEGSALGRFASNAGEMLNPVSMVKGLADAARHPIQTVENVVAASADQGRKAWDAAKKGRPTEALGRTIATVPIVGPAAAAAGEQIASGDIAGGLGKGAGLVAAMGLPTVVRGAKKAVAALPERAAKAVETAASSRVADVIAPKVGANKARFGGMADDVAPTLAKDMANGGAPWSREGLHAHVGAKLAQAEQALDAASDARLAARTFPTQPLIKALQEKRNALTAEAVEGSRSVPTLHGEGGRPTPAGQVRDVQTGRMKPELTAEGRPIGRDVVPGPNAARVAEIDRAIGELRELGPVTRYEPIRRIRQAYDGPAKTVYSPAVTADFLKVKGGALGSADVTGALREALAKWDPETAKANAQYSLYRTADDVLSATAEVERTRPKVGRQIMARLTGTVAGGQAGGAAGAVAGYVFAPAVDAALSSGVTTKLKTAALMTRLATAIRKGDVGMVYGVTYELKRLGTRAAGVLNTTNPSGSQNQTTAPVGTTP
jgi:hypothetical protein